MSAARVACMSLRKRIEDQHPGEYQSQCYTYNVGCLPLVHGDRVLLHSS